MPLDPNHLTKPILKLRKSFKKLRGVPSPDKVHQLRTRCRRLEANLQAVGFDQTKNGRRLLKAVTPFRKTAGKVRDMDVLTELASGLLTEKINGNQDFGEAPVQLLQQLGASRFRFAKRLNERISSERKSVLKRLKQFSRCAERRLKRSGRPSTALTRWQTDPTATAVYLSASLAEWPPLGRENLHAFRLCVKQLRYILDLSSKPDRKFMDALSAVKDTIGEWHDWCELETMGRKSIPENRAFCERIHSISDEKLHNALGSSNNLRRQYFDGLPEHNGRRRSKPIQLKSPVLISAAQMIAYMLLASVVILQNPRTVAILELSQKNEADSHKWLSSAAEMQYTAPAESKRLREDASKGIYCAPFWGLHNDVDIPSTSSTA
jgi:CHAD domain-containing protein